MIYVCLPSRNEAESVGLVLWKIRKVFERLGREYQVLVADDASDDGTRQVLDRYAEVLPMTVLRHRDRQGYARSVEGLLRRALALSDRPRRDCAIVMHADYSHRPEQLSEVVRRVESGADIVVGEVLRSTAPTRRHRMVRRFGASWLRSAVRVPGVRDPISGFVGFRLATLRLVLGEPDRHLSCEDWASSAELLALAAAQARRVETFPVDERHDLRARPSRLAPWRMARSLIRSRPLVRAAQAQATLWASERSTPSPDSRPKRTPRRRGRKRRS